jgi:hypothetical protein
MTAANARTRAGVEGGERKADDDVAQEEDRHAFLGGEPHFMVEEVEVFAIDQERPRHEASQPEQRKKSVFASFVNRLRGSKRAEPKQ